MADLDLMKKLTIASSSKIVLLVFDGLGGLPPEANGLTELEAAFTPNLDKLASEGTLGQTIPIRRGITPGSGPAHLALFGYDPLTFDVGRGVLEATGIGMKVQMGDIAARGNFCTVDVDGNITDRRAGRISSEAAQPLVEKLDKIHIEGVEVVVNHVKEYRLAVVIRGEGLDPSLKDTDPQKTGVPPLQVVPKVSSAKSTAQLFNLWISEAREVLADQEKANCLTLRGFSTDPALPTYSDVYNLNPACIAAYPMYKGVSRLVGMEVIDFDGDLVEDEFSALANNWNAYDFFFVHIKKTDSRGEDGDFAGKVAEIEAVDRILPNLLNLNPDVLVVTGDHSTPSQLRMHSWHPVPMLLWAPKSARPDDQKQFGEKNCTHGGFGTILATDLMPLMLAHAGRLEKFGA
jgi:2,3-bisphosphoglycerate-independent phosphoglycerate mutase